MIVAEIHSIFPTPVYRSKLARKFTEKELRFVQKMRKKFTSNVGNITSANSYVLDNPSFTTLKKEMDLFIEDYFSKIVLPPETISPYITQSWLNYTETKGYHHRHNHQNSYLSGILYINADEAHDKITFAHNRYDQIKLSPTKWNLFNSDSWFFPVKTGEIIMFPSHMTHLVEKKQGKNTRVSLSFNVFLKGDLGNKDNLTQLKL